MKEKIKKYWWIILIVVFIILVVLYFSFILDIGINSKYFIKKDFIAALTNRKTGNCTAFKSYLLKDIEEWGKRCIDENNLDNPQIKEFSIRDISINGDSAFLQIDLERSPTAQMRLLKATGELKNYESKYSATYTIEKQITEKKFLFLFPQTRWFINQELK